MDTMRPQRSFRAGVWLLFLASAGAPATATGFGISLELPPSVRSAGMGGASNAVFWGGDADYWGNPALVAFHHGVRYEFARTRLVPTLAKDVYFTSHRGTAAGGGIGLAFGSLLLDYGQSVGVDPGGNPTGTFSTTEDIRSWGAGVSVSELARSIGHLRGTPPPRFTRYADVAIGYAHQRVQVSMLPYLEGEATTSGLGVFARLTPLDTFGSDASDPMRFDLGVGWSALNRDEETPTPSLFGMPRIHRFGVAARFERGRHAAGVGATSSRHPLAGTYEPFITAAVAVDMEHFESYGASPPSYDVQRYGLEGQLLNVLALRVGRVEDRDGDIEGWSFGVGAGYTAGRFGRVQYDFAAVPQSKDLHSMVKRHALSVTLHPMTLLHPGR
jgi:hypothetical protein